MIIFKDLAFFDMHITGLMSQGGMFLRGVTEDKSEKASYYMSRWMIMVLFVLYMVCIFVGMVGMVYTLFEHADSTEYIINDTVYSALSCGLAMSSMQYTRKLYKSCIGQRIIVNEVGIKEVGYFAYFLFRPLFACIFIVVAIFALKGGIVIITDMPWASDNSRFLYVSTIIAAVIGYDVGDMLESFEEFSRRKINKHFEGEHNG